MAEGRGGLTKEEHGFALESFRLVGKKLRAERLQREGRGRMSKKPVSEWRVDIPAYDCQTHGSIERVTCSVCHKAALATVRREERERWQDTLFPGFSEFLRRDTDPEGVKFVIDEGQKLVAGEASREAIEVCLEIVRAGRERLERPENKYALSITHGEIRALLDGEGEKGG